MNWIWITKYRTPLIAAASIFVLVAIGVPVWLYRAEQQHLTASESYTAVLKKLKKDDPASEKETRDALEKIDLSLAQLYAAHLSLKLGETDKAAKTYEAFLAKVPATDPLRPLAMAGLKTCYEALKQPEKAKNLQADLEKLGFAENP